MSKLATSDQDANVQNQSNKGETLFENGEFVIYSTTEDQVQYDAQTVVGSETGIVNISLWVRYPDEGREIPIFSQSEQGTWLSMSTEIRKNCTPNAVSESFIEALARLTDDSDETNEWGGVAEKVWEQMSFEERYIVEKFRNTLYGGSPSPEAVQVLESCENRMG